MHPQWDYVIIVHAVDKMMCLSMDTVSKTCYHKL